MHQCKKGILQNCLKVIGFISQFRINEWLTEVEHQMRLTLANNLAKAVQGSKSFREGSVECDPFIKWVDSYQVQIIALAAQISWSEDVESALTSNAKKLKDVLTRVEDMLKLLADLVLQNQPPLRRKKLEHLIYEYVHRRYVSIYFLFIPKYILCF